MNGSVHQRVLPCRAGTTNAAQIAKPRPTYGISRTSTHHALVPIDRKITIHGPTSGMNAMPGLLTLSLFPTTKAATHGRRIHATKSASRTATSKALSPYS